ncbi:bifunctional 2-polyprenyl-6-hydroxyphenol methylase/3-demethylubiquinol 3-O-methyltransferase UbiG [Kiloniella sp. EL199]|uniref:class I SAM-dependent methyltransferase n=1 Tax=Kiloniella sp. EL199 TaxID=2107581 RepID=UPI000EA22993|nr:class I SAM-dependent methyltransferase [Kiloniella sp. EL199]
MSNIKKTLQSLNLVQDETCEVYADCTRDVPNLKVYKDRMSGIIFIEDFYTGEETYELGEYREIKTETTGQPDLERSTDLDRRTQDYKQFYKGKTVLDLGCGAGDFLLSNYNSFKGCIGIELEERCLDHLRKNKINCFNDLVSVKSSSIDTIFAFHSLEHFLEPLKMLAESFRILKEGGTIIIEVPHAKDFLLQQLNCNDFKNFTLWSQHLILHTRESLFKFLTSTGFHNITIQGKQRYPLSNHLTWLSKKRPGGHKNILSSIDNDQLKSAYEASLQMIDATDTLVAIAKK